MTLDDLLAREAIRDLVTRYNSYGDSGRFEPLWELFTADAVMEVGPAGGERIVFDGLEQIKQIFTGAQARVKDQLANARPAYVRHYTATHQIDLVDADHATGRLYFAVILGHGLDHWGRYLDRYVRVGEAWKFADRRVHVDGQRDDSWFGL
jgi:hypothetical protein